MNKLSNPISNFSKLAFSSQWIDRLFSASNKVWVGFSGGVDSCVLLHSLTSQLSAEQKARISAIHVHHGLSGNADEWLSFCQAFCQRLGVHFVAEQVTLKKQASLENAAREARYKAFERALGPRDILLLAHHAGDQTETVLFRLCRGTGGKGLSGMPFQRTLGDQGAYLLRPLLAVSKADIEHYAQRHQLQWVEDESNENEHFTRNFLRHSVVPNLQQRFPKLESNIVSTAKRIETDYAMLAKFATAQLDVWCNELGGLDLSKVTDLPVDERLFWLRQFLAARDVSLPHAQLVSIDTMFLSGMDRQPEFHFQDKGSLEKRLLRHQNALYLLPQDLPVVLGKLIVNQWLERAFDSVRVLNSQGCELKSRPLGEDLLFTKADAKSRRKLKKWLNDQGIPSWWREHLPYIYQGDELVAIGNLWSHPDWQGEVEWILSEQLPFFASSFLR